MPDLGKTIGVTVDLAGCPNRCRHCYLGVPANPQLPPDVLREVADAFWGWQRPGEGKLYFEQVYVSSWYREPDFSADYRQLHELERELSRAEPRRYELLSIWRLARDPDYAAWARAVGPSRCQISFFGLEETTDFFVRRAGAFQDALTATERLLDVGMVPRWQFFLTKPGMPELPALMDLIDDLRLQERVAELGDEFGVFCHPPGLSGEARNMQEFAITEEDLPAIPQELMAATVKHFGGAVNWGTERAALERLEAGEEHSQYVPDEMWFFVDGNLDVYPNCSSEIGPEWRLGNLPADGIDAILRTFEQDGTPGLHASRHIPCVELGRRFADAARPHVHSMGDCIDMWIHRSTASQRE
jgi:hypothetical protein